MKPNAVKMIALAFFAFALGAARHAQAQDAKSPFPTSMAPLDQYLMDRDAEIAKARSAAPPSIANPEPVTEFIVEVSDWSDGTPADSGDHAH